MFTSKLGRVGAVALCLLAVKVAAGCSDTGTPQANGVGGAAGQSPGTAGGGVSSAGVATSGGSNATAGVTSGGGATAGSAAGGAGGAAAGSGGAAGNAAGGAAAGAGGAAGGAGGNPAMTFAPCNTAPSDTVPALKRGPAITGFQGMQTAGLITAVPGEVGTLYVIGHRNGAVYTVQDGKVAAMPLVNVDVANGGNNEQGLLSMAFHPSFATNHLFYLFYTAAGNGAMTIDEFERLTPTTSMKKRNIYSHERAGGGMFHNGGSLSFNPKDAMPYLYFSVGNNESNNAGDPNGFAGRVLRFDLESKASTTFAYGLRNPYRMTVDRLTGDMYIADVANGPGGTVIFNANGKTGTDYGYRNNNGDPDVNNGILRDNAGAAIIGGYVYRGNKIPGLCGRYFYGNYQGGTVKSIVVKDGKKAGDTASHAMLSVPGDITSFGEDGEGELYMASMNNTIYKIVAQ